jgi:hypothetical protein
MKTFQASILFEISLNSSKSSQYKLHHNPNFELFAKLIASSKLQALIIGATGQKTSSSNTFIQGFTSFNTVGGNKFESSDIAFHQVNNTAQSLIESFICNSISSTKLLLAKGHIIFSSSIGSQNFTSDIFFVNFSQNSS